MNTLAFRLVLAILAALVLHSRAAAEDIDLYVSGGSASAPNVLFYLDNTSNWAAQSQAWAYSDVLAKCDKYSGSAQTTCQSYVYEIFCNSKVACAGKLDPLEQGLVEVRALKLVLNQLVCSQPADKALNINAGLMMFNNGVSSVDSPSARPGYIRHEVKSMAAQCAEKTDVAKSIIAGLDNIASNFQGPDFKTNGSADYGAGFYEAFKYFGGWSRPNLIVSGSGTAGSPMGATGFGPIRYSTATPLEDPNAFIDPKPELKTTYKSPINSENSCGKNYIILIGNGFPASYEYGTDANASPPTNKLMSRLTYDPGPQIYPVPFLSNQKSDVRFADEWARFLFRTDVSPIDGQQRVQTFTIDVYNKSQDAKQAKLLQTIAAVGQGSLPGNDAGGYYSVGGDLMALINALKETLMQIASVNSVFASASLPVSVNAQGTFLNQVFMGVFRPHEKAYQRWAGNMKQYQFALQDNALFLADSVGKQAVDSGSGFIRNCAKSYWTTDSDTYWQSVTGTESSCGDDATYADFNKYSDAPDGPIVERGGSAQQLRKLGHAARNIRTCTTIACGSVVDFNTTNVTIPSTSLSQGTTSATLVQWARGENVGDGNSTVDSTGTLVTTTYATATAPGPTTRPTVHGEVVHSRPLAVNYGSGSTNDVVVFYGAGDGMLHAVSGNQTGPGAGNELWAFIAPEHWNLLDRVHSNTPVISYPGVTVPGAAPKTYFFDGSIGGYQEVTGGALSKLWIYPTMRRGGRAVYAFDATKKPGTGVNQPTLMWKFTDDSSLGQTWSTPVAIRAKIGTATTTLVAFGAGYDNCEDGAANACDGVTQGRGIFVMDAANGKTANYRFFDPGSTAGRFVADMTAVDANNDGIIDLLYAVDTRGNIWRINTTNPNSGFTGYSSVEDWPINKIATVSDWSTASERRKFMYAPSVVMLGTQASVLVGTGDREKPLPSGSAASVNNRFYGIRDDITKVGALDASGSAVANTPAVVNGAGTDAELATANKLTNVTSVTTPVEPTSLAPNGWYRNLSTTSTPFEQVVTTPLTIGGQTYFSTFQAKSSTGKCSMGTGRAYKVDFQTGVISPNADGQYVPDTFSSEGIPPSPVGGLVSIDGKTVPFCIGCTGPTVLSPNKIVPKVKPDRKPVYRSQKIDS